MLVLFIFLCIAIVLLSIAILVGSCFLRRTARVACGTRSVSGSLLTVVGLLCGLAILVNLNRETAVTGQMTLSTVSADDASIAVTSTARTDQSLPNASQLDEPDDTDDDSTADKTAITDLEDADQSSVTSAADSATDLSVETTAAAESQSSADQQPAADTAEASPHPVQLSEVIIDYEARPDWVEYNEDLNVGSVYQIAVSSGPHVRYEDARKELGKQLEQEASQYINEIVGHPQAANWLGFDAARIRDQLVQADHVYDEKIISPSFGVMHQSHALLQFDAGFRERLQTTWQEIVVRGRLLAFGLLAAVLIGALSLLLTYFRADTATKGFYTGRLRFATVLVILGLIVVGAALARSIPWIWL